MEIENRKLSEKLISTVEELRKSISTISVYDFSIYSSMELYYTIANKLNEVINMFNQLGISVTDEILEINECLQYLLNEGLKVEVANKINELVADGTMAQIINEEVFKLLNKKIENKPISNLKLERIGRKINYGENPKASNYSPTGMACMMQGGCKIDDYTIAYMLWDSLNTGLNNNKLIIMNLYTGNIINEKEFNFGWCNSLAYNDGKIYVAERGNSAGNNGLIHVIDYATLNQVDILTIDKNVNAISIFDNELYVLEENTSIIHKYDLDGNSLNKKIVLNIPQYYNQNILITDEYIFLLSSQPSNLINIFNKKGEFLKCYNLPKYGGIYYVGEPQFIIDFDNYNFVLGSSVSYFNEFNNQFFKFNLVNDVNESSIINNYANTINVNSSVNVYNPTGEAGNEFTSINECVNLNIRNIIINGNNKDYKYTYISDNEGYIRIQNAKFTEGVFIQYARIVLKQCNINFSLNGDDNSCLRVRDTTLFLDNCNFNANNNSYCINTERNSILKIITPTFTNYTSSVVNNPGSGNIIDFNNYENMPFVRHSNLRKYSLFSKGFINNFVAGSYTYNTNLSADEIQSLLDNCTRVKIIYLPFNNSTKTVELTRSSSQTYTIVDSTIVPASNTIRHCKTEITLSSVGYTINSNDTLSYDSSSITADNTSTNSNSYMFNTIRSIELIP